MWNAFEKNIVDNARNGHTKNWNDLLKKKNEWFGW